MPSSEQSKDKLLQRALIRVLRPMVRLLLANGMAYNDFASLARSIFVEVAHKEMVKPGRKQSLSNVAVVTGIHRHEVKRLLESPPHQQDPALKHNRAARVIAGWRSDPDYSDKTGPFALDRETDFKTLIQRYSGDITSRAIIEELMRIGAIKQNDDNTISLIVPAYLPILGDEELVEIFGDSVADLISTFEFNMSTSSENRRLQMTAIQDNLPNEVMEDVEAMISARSMKFLTELNTAFQTQDRDSNPNLAGTGRNRAGVGLYFFREKLKDD